MVLDVEDGEMELIADCRWEETSKLRFVAATADCNTIYNYFSYTPAIKGTYIVSIDFSDYDEPKVTITKK